MLEAFQSVMAMAAVCCGVIFIMGIISDYILPDRPQATRRRK